MTNQALGNDKKLRIVISAILLAVSALLLVIPALLLVIPDLIGNLFSDQLYTSGLKFFNFVGKSQ